MKKSDPQPVPAADPAPLLLPSQKHPNVSVALAAAMADVGGQEKKGRNAAQGYNYVEAREVARAVQHALAKHGLHLTSKVTIQSDHHVEVTGTKGARMEHRVLLLLDVVAHHGDSETSISIVTGAPGLGYDSGDKAFNKAMTVAYKYAMNLAFSIGSPDDPEADAETDSVVRAPPAPPQTKTAVTKGPCEGTVKSLVVGEKIVLTITMVETNANGEIIETELVREYDPSARDALKACGLNVDDPGRNAGQKATFTVFVTGNPNDKPKMGNIKVHP